METKLIVGVFVLVLTLIFLIVIVFLKQIDSGTYKRDSENRQNAMGKGMGIGIAIGMGAGVALGSALDSMGLGIAIGAGIGVSMGIAFGSAFKKKEEEKRDLNQQFSYYTETAYKKIPVFLGILAVLIGLLLLGIIFLI